VFLLRAAEKHLNDGKFARFQDTVCHTSTIDQVVAESDAMANAPWITPELIERTQHVWQHHSPIPLTQDDAIEILIAFGRLADALALSAPETMPTNIMSS
jgi:hypothetical protein